MKLEKILEKTKSIAIKTLSGLYIAPTFMYSITSTRDSDSHFKEFEITTHGILGSILSSGLFILGTYLGKGYDYTFSQEGGDIIFAHTAISHLTNYASMFREIHRARRNERLMKEGSIVLAYNKSLKDNRK